MVETGPRLIHKDGIRYFIRGDLNHPELKTLMLRARIHLEEAKRHNIFDLDEIHIEKANEYTADSRFGIDTIRISLPEVEEVEKRLFEKESVEVLEETSEEYIIAHEVWISPKSALGYPDCTQVGYLLCLGGGWNPPYQFIEPIVKTEEDEENEGETIITRNVIHPYANKAQWDVEVAKGVTVYPFLWNSWKGFAQQDPDILSAHSWDDVFGFWPDGRPWESLNLPNNELQEVLVFEEYEDVVIEYYDIPCILEEHVVTEFDLYKIFHTVDDYEDERWDIRQECESDVWKHYFEFAYGAHTGNPHAPSLSVLMTRPGGRMDDYSTMIVMPGTEFTYQGGGSQGEGYILVNRDCAEGPSEPPENTDYYGGITYDEETGEGSQEVTAQYLGNDYYTHYADGWGHAPTWSSCKDPSKYAYYYEYETEWINEFWEAPMAEGDIFRRYNFEQGFDVNGKRYVINEGVNMPYAMAMLSGDCTKEDDTAEGVCVKYFESPEWVIATIQRSKGYWDSSCPGFGGPQMWFIWIDVQAEELHWDLTIPNAVWPDDWIGGIFGASTLFHFREIPDAPPYIDQDENEHPLLTAGQFRLFKRTVEEVYEPIVRKESYEY